MTRRQAMCGMSAAGALYCNLPGVAGLREDTDLSLARAFALSVVSNRVAARAIANAYLARVAPSEAAKLLRSLMSRLREEAGAHTRDAARRLAGRLVRTDFRNTRLTIVDGWRLSNTEIALCVLAKLPK
jgi:hypothetical protein